MSFLREVHLDDNFGPFVAFQENFGFIPKIFRAQTLLPRVIEVQAHIAGSLLIKEKALSRVQKEQILLTVAAAEQSTYCVTAHSGMLRSLGIPEPQLVRFLSDFHHAGLSAADQALLDFSLKLSHRAPWVDSEDIQALRSWGFDDESILEAIQVTALTRFLCTLSVGLAPEPDFEPRELPSTTITPPGQATFRSSIPHGAHAPSKKGPYLRSVYQSPKTFAPFAFFQKTFGFIPNIFRAQTLRPDMLEAEAEAVAKILLPEDVLSRVQKECILLAVSAANLNSYCVAVHCNMLRGLGLPSEESDQIAVDHHYSNLSQADKALLDFALKLAVHAAEFSRHDIDRLRVGGFSEEQILESVVMTALTNFLNTLQMGLGTVPDFELRLVFGPNKVHLPPAESRPTQDGSAVPLPSTVVEDADAGLVAKAQTGNLEAFEALIRRHSPCVYRTLMAILADPEEAKDAMQDVFLSAFKNIAKFAGRSKFSTWLVSIARNTAFQRLRDRKNMESLDEDVSGEEEEFRPRQVRAWQDDPELMYSHAEIRQLVEKGIMRLPTKLRVVVMLRDIEQLSTEEVARQLALSVPALKARLFRGRLMLRELLSSHFMVSSQKAGL
jgi:RNA polymerase sigma-70 factor (ECF subfamily)